MATLEEMQARYDELASEEENLRRNLGKVSEEREVLHHAIAAQEAADRVMNPESATNLNVQSGILGQKATEPKE